MCPPETTPYQVDCMIDSICQLDLLRKKVIPYLYCHPTLYPGRSIIGVGVDITSETNDFPLQAYKKNIYFKIVLLGWNKR